MSQNTLGWRQVEIDASEYNSNAPALGEENIAFAIEGSTKISKLYIHTGYERELAKQKAEEEETKKAYDKVRDAIDHHEKTITLSVGQLTTGITVPEWTAVLMLSNIKSPATNTIPCFQAIMSTYKPEYKDSIPWWQCTTLPEILHHSGYCTYWVSNQSKIGIFDTVIGRYADLCNHNFFVGDKFAGMHRNKLDEEIIPLIIPLLQNTNSNSFYFIHLMGSHSTFKNRYPPLFDKFKPEDYETYPKHQRENLATYDNSILYNDSVVNEIICLFQKQETIIFYFSDHAIDAYESSDDYMAHAKGTDPKSVEAGSKIPFMIYTSPLYQQNFPNEMEQIKRCTEQPFRTDDMIYTIMDIIGVTFKGESLEGKSIFQLSSNKNN